MKKFEKASYVPMTDGQILELIRSTPQAFQSLLDAGESLTITSARRAIEKECRKSEIWKNDKYQVAKYAPDGPKGSEWPPMIHLSIKRIDRQPIHDWRDLQEIKNQLCGPECEAVELYPAESRVVDAANQYHLWVLTDPKVFFPFGFDRRFVNDCSVGGAVQRPFDKGESL